MKWPIGPQETLIRLDARGVLQSTRGLSRTGIFTISDRYFHDPREPTPVFRVQRISIRWEGSMRSYLLTAAILAASVSAPPAGASLAEEIHQPGAAPSVSTDANYKWQTVLSYQGIQAVLGKEVRSSAEENL